MKKIISLLLALGLILASTACSASTNSQNAINDYLVKQALSIVDCGSFDLMAEAQKIDAAEATYEYIDTMAQALGETPSSVSLFLNSTYTISGYGTASTLAISTIGSEALAAVSEVRGLLIAHAGYAFKLPKGFEGNALVVLTYSNVTAVVCYETSEQHLLKYGVYLYPSGSTPITAGNETKYDEAALLRADNRKDPAFMTAEKYTTKALMTKAAEADFEKIQSSCSTAGLQVSDDEILACCQEAMQHSTATVSSMTLYTGYIGDLEYAGQERYLFMSYPMYYMNQYGTTAAAYASITACSECYRTPEDLTDSAVIVAAMNDGTYLILSAAVDTNGFCCIQCVYDVYGDAISSIASSFSHSTSLS